MEEAIEQASKVMTIRQGDLIFIERQIPSQPLVREEVFQEIVDAEEVLYCKIK